MWQLFSFSFLIFAHSLNQSGAEGLRVCRFICPDWWWQWNSGGHLYCWAGPAPCWGVLGIQPFRPVRSATIWWSQRHHKHTSALPLAAHPPRPGPHTYLRCPPPGSAEWLQDPLPAQCAVWVSILLFHFQQQAVGDAWPCQCWCLIYLKRFNNNSL